MALVRGFFGIGGVMFVAGIAAAGEYFSGGGSRLTPGVRTSLADLANPPAAAAQVVETAHARELSDEEIRNENGNTAPQMIPASDPRSDEEALNEANELRRLESEERALLTVAADTRAKAEISPSGSENEEKAEPVPTARKAGNASAPESSGEDLDSLREAKRSLELQQEYLLKQVIKYRRQVQALESGGTDARKGVEDAAAQIKSLQEAVLREQARVRELEQGQNDLKSRADENLRKVADYAVGLKKELQQLKEDDAIRFAENEKLRTQLEQANVRVSERMKQEEELAKMQGEHSTLAEQIAAERRQREALEQERDALRRELNQLRETTSGSQEEFEETKRQLSKAVEELRALQQAKGEQESQAARAAELEAALQEARTTLEKNRAELDVLTAKTKDQEELLAKLPDMRRELVASKNLLIMKEQEVRLLRKGSGSGAQVSLGGETQQNARESSRAALSSPEIDRHMEESGRRAGVETIRGKSAPPAVPDAMVVEVIVGRAALRSGPSPDDSELMSVAKTTRLTVEERRGDWYRVITPNSNRAYIRADLVRPVSGDAPVRNEPASATAAATVGDAPAAPRPAPAAAGARPPKKKPLQVGSGPDMVPFGDVKGNATTSAQDSIDRAFERLRKGVGTKPMTPEMINNSADPTE